MKFGQLLQLGTKEDVLQVCEIPLGVDLLCEGVGEMQLLKVDEIGEYPGMVESGDNVQVIVVQNQSLHVAHFVKSLSLNLLYLIVRQIDDLELCSVLPYPEYVPGQSPEPVSLEDEDLGLAGDVLEYRGVCEPGVGAVGHEHLPVGLPRLVVAEPALTQPGEPLGAASVISLVSIETQCEGEETK